MTSSAEPFGPVDYLVVEFPADDTTPSDPIAFEVAALHDTELIRILDLVVVTRHVDGTVTIVECHELGCERLAGLDGRLTEVLSEHDVAQLATTLTPGATGMALLFENTWAAPLCAAASESGSSITAAGTIPATDLHTALCAARVRGSDGAGRSPVPGGDILHAPLARERPTPSLPALIDDVRSLHHRQPTQRSHHS